MPGLPTMMASSSPTKIASDLHLLNPETQSTDIHKLFRAICHTNISSMLKRAHGGSPKTDEYLLMLTVPALFAANSNNLFEFDWMCDLAQADVWQNLKLWGWITNCWSCCVTGNFEHGSLRPRGMHSQYYQSASPLTVTCYLSAESGYRNHPCQHPCALHRTFHCFWIEGWSIPMSDYSSCFCFPIVRYYDQIQILYFSC